MTANLSQQIESGILTAAFAWALALSGCVLQSQQASPKPALPVVSYQGDVLLVDGARYSRGPRTSDYEVGNVLLFAQPGRTEDLVTTLVRFGLTSKLHESSAGDWFVVEVPAGFEAQWIAAFQVVPGVASAHLNHRLIPYS